MRLISDLAVSTEVIFTDTSEGSLKVNSLVLAKRIKRCRDQKANCRTLILSIAA